jgi:quercetin dioxygenase-like cupin family protein
MSPVTPDTRTIIVARTGERGFTQVCEGIRRKTLVYGKNTLITEFLLEKGSRLPAHHHPEEQPGYLVSGRIIFHIGDEDFPAGPHDCWTIPGGTEHRAEILENSVAVEVFSPVREDYLP